ncbi:unnamed protein product [Clonostachys rosea]|uniref:Store-operated calcium entry-associated regulatory factor n=1 Tax=Bionectria ochroleuca TaxID=29856 RepID=A0ABY6U763_BIOOC|nr:unnamed protein product [Clonostachys rosea]
MKPSFSALVTSLLLVGSATAWGSSAKSKNAILLSNVQSLTLRGNGAKTTNRRVSAVPQLKCVSHPDLCRRVNIDVMRCTNQGSSYGTEDIEWSCAASLPEEFQLGSTNVICEGYANSDDPYVLKGSCGVEYTVTLTNNGERRYPDLADTVRKQSQSSSNTVFWAIFFIIAVCIGLAALLRHSENTAPQQRRPRTRRGGGGSGWGGGGGGGGGGGPGGWNPGWGSGDNDAPPPYSEPKPYPSSSSSSSWRPGFWSGIAAGSAAGYAAGRRGGGSSSRAPTYSDYTTDSGWGRSHGESSSSQSGRSGPSGDTHESTGFGSTSRR